MRQEGVFVTTVDILTFAMRIMLIAPAIILHEVSHGYVAYLLGDPTAKNAGRLTLNPFAHIDPYGTIILPALMFFLSSGAFAIGYAKPVPINPHLMTKVSYQNGLLLSGIAGPVTNILLAILSALGLRAAMVFGAPGIVYEMLLTFTLINLVLAFFNLIPIPPLDGSRVVQRFLSGNALRAYHSLERYGIFIVLAVAFILPSIIGFNVLRVYLDYTVYPMLRLLTGVAI